MTVRIAVILSNTPQPSFEIIGKLFAQSFREAGVLVSERGIPQTSLERAALAREYEGQPVVFFHNVAMGHDFQVIPGAKNVALPAYEFSRIYDSAVTLLNRYDEIWVTTSHVAAVLENSGVNVSIYKIPPALDRGNYPHKLSYEPHRPFRFLFVGEPHFRKGVHFLMYGFIKAFPDMGEAELLIKTRLHPSWATLRDDIKLLTEQLPLEDLGQLYVDSDCYISASLAEGLGLPIAEAMLCGLPVCTNWWGGHRDLLTDGGYFPLTYVESPRPWTGEPQYYTPGQKCALSDETSVAQAMRSIIGISPAERCRMAEKAKENLENKYGVQSLRAFWLEQTARLWGKFFGTCP
jgi:glycosyltransferase involved in cell wall biosynthesis